MKYQTKAEALQHLSKNPLAAKKQTAMIDYVYDECGSMVSQINLDGIEIDCHQSKMSRVMSY